MSKHDVFAKKNLIVLVVGLMICFACVSCKTVDSSGDVSATMTTVKKRK